MFELSNNRVVMRKSFDDFEYMGFVIHRSGFLLIYWDTFMSVVGNVLDVTLAKVLVEEVYV